MNLDSVRNLLLPACYEIPVHYGRPGEGIALHIDNMSSALVASYYLYDEPTGDTMVVCSQREAIDGSFRHHLKNRLISLLHKGRKRFSVRRFVMADIEKPTISERHQHVSTRPIKRGKFKRVNSNHLPVIRIPRLLSVSPLS